MRVILPMPSLILSSMKTTSFRRMVWMNMKMPELPFRSTNRYANPDWYANRYGYRNTNADSNWNSDSDADST